MVLNGVADEVKRIVGIPRAARFFSNAESAVDVGDHPARIGETAAPSAAWVNP
jgi:hypothetical protein